MTLGYKNIFDSDAAVTASRASTDVLRFEEGGGNVGDGQGLRIYVQTTEDFVGTGAKEVTAVTCSAENTSTGTADGDLSGDYWKLYTIDKAIDGAEKKYAVWYQTGSSTAPTVAGYTLIPVEIASEAADTVVATATAAAINAAVPEVTAVAAAAVVTVTNKYNGAVTTAVDGDTGDQFGFSRTTQGVANSTLIVALQHSADGTNFYDMLRSGAIEEPGGVTDGEARTRAGGVLLEATVPKGMKEYHRVYYTRSAAMSAGKITAGYMKQK